MCTLFTNLYVHIIIYITHNNIYLQHIIIYIYTNINTDIYGVPIYILYLYDHMWLVGMKVISEFVKKNYLLLNEKFDMQYPILYPHLLF